MKTRRVTWMLLLSILVLLAGCDGGDSTDELTVDNLQGLYDLDVPASMLENLIDDDAELRSGVLDIDATTVIFTIIGVMADSYVIANAEMVTVTEADGDTVDIQASLTNNGRTLNLVDINNGNTLVLIRRGAGLGTNLTVANLQGTYDLDVANSSRLDLGNDDFVITAALLEVTTTMFTLTATGTFEGTYRIADETTVTVTEADGDISDFSATLSENSTRLRLVGPNGGIFLLDKQ